MPEFAKSAQGKVRDFVALVNESVANDCQDNQQLAPTPGCILRLTGQALRMVSPEARDDD